MKTLSTFLVPSSSTEAASESTDSVIGTMPSGAIVRLTVKVLSATK